MHKANHLEIVIIDTLKNILVHVKIQNTNAKNKENFSSDFEFRFLNPTL